MFLWVVLGWCLVVGCWVIRVCRCSRAVPLHPTAASVPVTRHVHAHQCPSPSSARGVDPMFPLTLQSGWCPGIVWRALARAQTRANRRRWFVARFCKPLSDFSYGNPHTKTPVRHHTANLAPRQTRLSALTLIWSVLNFSSSNPTKTCSQTPGGGSLGGRLWNGGLSIISS